MCSKAYVCEINVIVGEASVFECIYYHLYLSRDVSLWRDSFLIKVQYFVFFLETGKEWR